MLLGLCYVVFPAVAVVPAVNDFSAVADDPAVAVALLLLKYKKFKHFRLSHYDYQFFLPSDYPFSDPIISEKLSDIDRD